MASTVPTYKTCIKAAKVGKEYTGNYTEKACATKSAPGKGEYELASYTKAKKLDFKSKSGKSTLYSYIPGVGVAGTVVCAKDKGVGTITGERTAESVVTFEKCESSGFKCTSTGAKAGDIVTNPLNEGSSGSTKAKTKLVTSSKPSAMAHRPRSTAKVTSK